MTARRATSGLVAALASVAVVLVSGLPASAHAKLVEVSPADGSTVVTAPERVVLTFDENLGGQTVVTVTGPDGQRVDSGDTQVVDNTATVAVDSTAAGGYRVAVRALSADGHPVTDTAAFTLRTAADPTAGSDAPPGSVGESGGAGRGWVAGGIAAAALVGGLLLLTAHRRDPSTSRSR